MDAESQKYSITSPENLKIEYALAGDSWNPTAAYENVKAQIIFYYQAPEDKKVILKGEAAQAAGHVVRSFIESVEKTADDLGNFLQVNTSSEGC